MPVFKRTLIVWIITGSIGLTIFILFFNHAFPTASVDIRFSKEDAFRKAYAFIESQKFDLTDFDHTIIFNSDYYASAYLQKKQGIRKANDLISKGIPVWFWHIRWFKELEKEEFIVEMDPSTGKIIYFSHSILDDEQGANLTLEEARKIAEEEVGLRGIDLTTAYELKNSVTENQKHRTDYQFVWEKKDFKIEDSNLRVKVEIYGDSLGTYREYLKIPEDFIRSLKREISLGTALTMMSNIMILLITMLAVFMLIIQNKKAVITLKFGLIFGCVVIILKMFTFLNNLPLLWNFYPDTLSKSVFFTVSAGNMLNGALMCGFIIFAYAVLGQLFCRELGNDTKTPLFDAIINKKGCFTRILHTCVVGYSLGFLFLGYITLFYLIGTRFFNIWIPSDADYSNILATAMPFLFPLTVALSSAISEEFMFRWFNITFFKKTLKVNWLVVLIPALIWAFGHSSYPVFPVYVRGVELTLFGIILGVIFLKYGLETVIITHFVINASLGVLPLLRASNSYFFVSGVMVVSLAFIVPAGAFFIVWRNSRQCVYNKRT